MIDTFGYKIDLPSDPPRKHILVTWEYDKFTTMFSVHSTKSDVAFTVRLCYISKSTLCINTRLEEKIRVKRHLLM
jgi:hypothetical protein